MATGIDVENDPDAHGESDDNVSDDEDWPRRTKSGIRRYPDIPMDGKYTRPLDFYRHTVGYGDGGCLDLDYPIWLCGAISEHISDANTDITNEFKTFETCFFFLGTNYSGRWHTEGCSENIQAVGVYYLHIDDLLEGGALKFRPLAAPAESYADCWNIEVNRYMMPKTDVAVVFDNCLPHRFCSIRNSTSIARRRTFINFFVVSPTYPIHDISILDLPLVSCEQCEYLLKSIADESHRQKLPDLVINKILSFLKKQMWTTETDAKEFRSRVRYEMVHEKSGWSGIQYGNTGDIIFIKSTDDLKQLGKISAYEDLSRHPYHTESE
ncbi:unnamed protein product [Rotaria sp. Silwood2]|nr:unnamed protein product [Rotaria sp. Silwood2]